MAVSQPLAEVWQRGSVAGFDPLLMPLAHAFMQVQEDMRGLAERVSPEDAWARPGGAASIAFHIRHIAGATDRLLTYARGETLSDAQRAALKSEGADPERRPSLRELVNDAVAALDQALDQVRATSKDSLLQERKLGRAGLPTNVAGLLFHAAEHATRHTGQAITTAKILGALRAPG